MYTIKRSVVTPAWQRVFATAAACRVNSAEFRSDNVRCHTHVFEERRSSYGSVFRGHLLWTGDLQSSRFNRICQSV